MRKRCQAHPMLEELVVSLFLSCDQNYQLTIESTFLEVLVYQDNGSSVFTVFSIVS